MAKKRFAGYDQVVTKETASSAWANLLQDGLQAEYELRWREHWAPSYVVQGLTPTVDDPNNQIDIASGEGYFDGKRYIGAESDQFNSGDATDSYFIYVDTADDALKHGTAWPAGVHLKLATVDWNQGTEAFSNFEDMREWKKLMLVLPIDEAVPDGTNPPTGPNVAGTNGQCRWRQWEFEDAADDILFWQFPTPPGYLRELHVFVYFIMASVTTGEVQFDGQLRGAGPGDTLDAAGADNQNPAKGLVTVPGTAGQVAVAEVDFGNVDLVQGEVNTLKLYRDVTDEGPSAAESADVFQVAVCCS